MPADPAPLPAMIVTGASGRVGRLLAAAWAATGAGVVLQYRADRAPSAVLPVLRWSPMDGPDSLADWCADRGAPRAMLVLAGVTPATGADLSLNTALAEACLSAAAAAGIGRVLVASSAAVYGAGRPEPWREDETPAPVTDYGRAKLAMEEACARWHGPGMTVCCLRIGNVAGADALLLNARAGAVLAIDRFADGAGPVRSYIGPQTLARVLHVLADPAVPLPPALNIAAPRPVAMAALATAAGLAWRWQPAPVGAVARHVLDCSALAALAPMSHTEAMPQAIAAQWIACRSQP